jgi:dTDP-4-dehydrorhamnose reductase
MKILLTGLNGTLAPVLARRLTAQGNEIVPWNRAHADPNDAHAVAQTLSQTAPDAIAHLAMGSAAWAGALARYACERSIPFLFTSTAMVFHHEPNGPHSVSDTRNAQDDYGRYKIECEDTVLAANSRACVVRIGWQIDPSQPGNNMLFALDEWQRRDGCVAASRAWIPACSFMADTAAALADLLRGDASGVFHLDSNADEAHSFDRIVAALKREFNRDAWNLRVHDEYVHDQRLLDVVKPMLPLSTRLSALLA